MGDQGWIQLHRKLLKNEMWQELNAVQKEITITVLLMASYKEKSWPYRGKIYEVKPGQFITSLNGILKKCSADVTTSKLRTTLEKLRGWGFLDWEEKDRGRLITITNWEHYQSKSDEEDKKEEPAPEPEPMPEPKREPKKKTKKGGKEPPEKKASLYDTEFKELWQEYPRKEGKREALTAYRRHRKAGVSLEDFREALERYKREIRQRGTPKQYIKQGKTFFNSGYEDYLEEDNEQGFQRVSYLTPDADDTQKYLENLFK